VRRNNRIGLAIPNINFIFASILVSRLAKSETGLKGNPVIRQLADSPELYPQL
jgi:hypothetical protein